MASVADAAFQAVTGKDFGDTVLAFLIGRHDSGTVVESNASSSADLSPVTVTPAANIPTNSSVTALTASLQQNGVDSTLAKRAILAYQKSMTLPDMALAIQ